MATEAPTVTANAPTATGMESVSLSNGFELHSNTTKAEDIKSNLNAKDETSEAASKLGKKSAEVRKIRPIPDKKVEKVETKPVEAPADAPEAETEDEPEVEVKAKDAKEKPLAGDPRSSATARVEIATREAREAREEAARLRQQLESFERGRTPQPTVQPQNAGDADFDWRKPPDQDEYAKADKSIGEFLKDYMDWDRAMQAEERHQNSERERAAETFHKNVETKLETFKGRLTEQFEDIAPEEVSDLISKCSFALPPGQRPHQVNVIADTMVLHCENPGRMEQFFRTDDGRTELQRIATLQTPTEIQLALAKVDYRLGIAATASPPAAKKERSEAKPPFRLVNGSPSTPSANESSESFDQRMARKYPNRRA